MGTGRVKIKTANLQSEVNSFINLASRFIGTYAPVAQPIMWFDGPPFVMEMLSQNLRPVLQSVEWPQRPYHFRNEAPLRSCSSTHALVLYELWQREEIVHDVLSAHHPFSFIYGDSWGRIAADVSGKDDFHPTAFAVRSPLQPCAAPVIVPTRAKLEQLLGRELLDSEAQQCLACLTLPAFVGCWHSDSSITSLCVPSLPTQCFVPGTDIESWDDIALVVLNQYSTRFAASLPDEADTRQVLVQ